MRTVTVFHSQTTEEQIIELSEDIYTWGELRPYIEEKFSLTNKKVTVQENDVTLELDTAQLPEGDFTLFVFVTNTKAGGDPLANYRGKEGRVRIMNKANNNLRRDVRKLNGLGLINLDPTMDPDELKKALIQAVAELGNSVKEGKKSKKKKIKKKKAKPETTTEDSASSEIVTFTLTPEPPKPPVIRLEPAEEGEIRLSIKLPSQEPTDELAKEIAELKELITSLPKDLAEAMKGFNKVMSASEELRRRANEVKHRLNL